jgi:tetratricopeptide (TPR) repeat protein
MSSISNSLTPEQTAQPNISQNVSQNLMMVQQLAQNFAMTSALQNRERYSSIFAELDSIEQAQTNQFQSLNDRLSVLESTQTNIEEQIRDNDQILQADKASSIASQTALQQGVLHLTQRIGSQQKNLNMSDSEEVALLKKELSEIKPYSDHDHSISIASRLLVLTPEDMSIRFIRGHCHFALNQMERAFEDISIVYDSNPKKYQIAHYMGLLFQKYKKDAPQAIKFFTQETVLSPRHSPSYVQLADLYYDLKDYTNAIIACQKALDFPEVSSNETSSNTLNRKLINSMFFRGIDYDRKGQYAEAFDDFTSVYAKDSNKDDHDYFLGYAYWNRNDIENAIIYFKQAIALNPSNLFAHHKLAESYLKKGDYSKAIEYCEKSIAMGSTYSNIPRFLQVAKAKNINS